MYIVLLALIAECANSFRRSECWMSIKVILFKVVDTIQYKTYLVQ